MSHEPELRLLLELDDERSSARWQQSVSLSLIAHLAVIIFALVEPMIFKSVKASLGVAERPPRRQLTYLAHPPDDQVIRAKPRTSILSDKDRMARPGPELPPKLPPLPIKPPEPPEKPAEKELLAKAQPPAPQPGPDSRTGQPQGQPSPLPLSDLRSEPPKLALPPGGSPTRSLEETLRGLARNRSGGGQAVGGPDGVSGVNPRAPASVGEARILSDTMGVDFDPYLRRVVADIRRNWYAVMPEIARLGKRGRVIVIFEILRDGGVPKLYLVTSSGSEPLDRASLAGISASVPFPPLPPEFSGPMVRLQVTFLYNMFFDQNP